MSICLISDLHLNEKRDDITEAFSRFLDNKALEFDDLYILGDLFEAWIGDDHQDAFISNIKSKLSSYSLKGKQIFVMHGNRDFLIGEDFCNSINGILIDDPYFIENEDQKILLTHGDIFCTDDKNYQDFKKIVRTEDWKKKFLSKSIKERITLANSLRKESSFENKKKSSEIMDVNIESLNKIVGKYKADIVIHGHVHKPKIHQEIFGKRYVLGDWDENLWYVAIRENEFCLEKEKI